MEALIVKTRTIIQSKLLKLYLIRRFQTLQ